MKPDISQNFINIVSKAVKNRIYGSVEIYFEDGQVTQITQRIINKVSTKKLQKKTNTDTVAVAHTVNK